MQDSEACKLEYNKSTKIFDLGQYLQTIATGISLDPNVFIGFGQRWNYGQSSKNVSISALVVLGKMST